MGCVDAEAEPVVRNAALRRRLRRALRTLPAPYRAVVFLREMEGLSYADALRELFGLDRAAPAAVTTTPLTLVEDDA